MMEIAQSELTISLLPKEGLRENDRFPYNPIFEALSLNLSRTIPSNTGYITS